MVRDESSDCHVMCPIYLKHDVADGHVTSRDSIVWSSNHVLLHIIVFSDAK